MSTNDTLRGLLAESRESLSEGLEDGGALEAEFSKRDRLLIGRIDAALAEPVSVGATVVFPEPDEIMQMAFEEGQPMEDASGYHFDLEEFDLFIDRFMAEVKALNGGAVAERDAQAGEVKP